MSGYSSRDARVLFVRFGAIGNAVAAIPAVRAVREAWPDAYLALLADPLTSELWQGCPFLDEVIVYDQKGKHRDGILYFRLIRELRKRRFTRSVHFRRFIRSELIGFLSGAEERVGFKSEARVQLLTRRVDYDEGVNMIDLNLRLARELGVKADDPSLGYWDSGSSSRVEEFYNALPGEGPVVVMHPGGATQRERLWPYYGDLACSLAEKCGARVVFVGSLGEEDIIRDAASKVKGVWASAAGFSLSEVSELISRAAVFVGTDSGPCHLAALVGTPGAVLYAPHRDIKLQLEKWKPRGEDYLAFVPERDCATCGEYPCSLIRQKECAAGIRVSEVEKGVERLLSRKKEED